MYICMNMPQTQFVHYHNGRSHNPCSYVYRCKFEQTLERIYNSQKQNQFVINYWYRVVYAKRLRAIYAYETIQCQHVCIYVTGERSQRERQRDMSTF